jgi:hypothetical protein
MAGQKALSRGLMNAVDKGWGWSRERTRTDFVHGLVRTGRWRSIVPSTEADGAMHYSEFSHVCVKGCKALLAAEMASVK